MAGGQAINYPAPSVGQTPVSPSLTGWNPLGGLYPDQGPGQYGFQAQLMPAQGPGQGAFGLQGAQANVLSAMAQNPPWAQQADISQYMPNMGALQGAIGGAYGMQGTPAPAPQTAGIAGTLGGYDWAGALASPFGPEQIEQSQEAARIAAAYGSDEIARAINADYAARGFPVSGVPAAAEARADIYSQLPGTLADIEMAMRQAGAQHGLGVGGLAMQQQGLQQSGLADYFGALLGSGQLGLGAGQLALQAQPPVDYMQLLAMLAPGLG